MSKRTTRFERFDKRKEVNELEKMSLRALRVNVGYTQEEAANMLKINKKTLYNWENGTSYPSVDKIPDICELYGTSYDRINFLLKNPL